MQKKSWGAGNRETSVKKWWWNLPRNLLAAQDGSGPWNQRHHKAWRTLVEPCLLELWRNFGGTLCGTFWQPKMDLPQGTRDTTKLEEPWWNLACWNFGGTLVEPSAELLAAQDGSAPGNRRHHEAWRTLVEPCLLELWRNLGGTFRGTFWQPKMDLAQGTRETTKLEEPWPNLACWNFGGTLVEPSAEPGTFWQPKGTRDTTKLEEPWWNLACWNFGGNVVEPSAEPFGSPRWICPGNQRHLKAWRTLVEPCLLELWRNLGGTFRGTFWQPKMDLAQGTRDTTKLEEPWWNLACWNFGGNVVEPSAEPGTFWQPKMDLPREPETPRSLKNLGGTLLAGTLAEPWWNLPGTWNLLAAQGNQRHHEAWRTLVEPCLLELWRNLGGTFRGTFWQPKMDLAQGTRDTTKFEEPWWNLACWNFCGTLVEPSAEPFGSPRWIWPREPETPQSLKNLGGTLLAGTLAEPWWNLPRNPEPFGSPREPETPRSLKTLGLACWNFGGTLVEPSAEPGTFWQPKGTRDTTKLEEPWWNLACWNFGGTLVEPSWNLEPFGSPRWIWPREPETPRSLKNLGGTLLAGTLAEPWWNLPRNPEPFGSPRWICPGNQRHHEAWRTLVEPCLLELWRNLGGTFRGTRTLLAAQGEPETPRSLKNLGGTLLAGTLAEPWWNLPRNPEPFGSPREPETTTKLEEPWPNLACWNFGGTLVEPSAEPGTFWQPKGTRDTTKLEEPWWNLACWNFGGTLVEPSAERGTFWQPKMDLPQGTGDTTKLEEPWWNLACWNFGGTLVEPSAEPFGSPRWICPGNQRHHEAWRTLAEPCLLELWRNLGGTFRGTFWQPKMDLAQGTRDTTKLEEPWRNLACWNFGGTLVEPSAEPFGSPRWICPREPKRVRKQF